MLFAAHYICTVNCSWRDRFRKVRGIFLYAWFSTVFQIIRTAKREMKNIWSFLSEDLRVLEKHSSYARYDTSKRIKWYVCRLVTRLGRQVGRRLFWVGPKFFKLCPIFLNYLQHIFPGGRTNIGGIRPLRPPWLRVWMYERTLL